MRIGIAEHYWTSWLDSPLGAVVTKEDAFIPKPTGATAQATTIKQSNQELQQLRQQSRNSVELVVKILANDLNLRVFQVVQYVVDPCRISFAQWQQAVKTSRSTLNMFMELAQNKGDEVFRLMLQRLFGGEGWHRLKFLDRDDVQPLECQMLDDDIVADKLLLTTCCMIGERLLVTLQYTHNLPGCLVLLLSSSDLVRNLALKRLRALWRWLLEAEAMAITDTNISAMLDELFWPGFVFIREILVAESEVNFTVVLEEVKVALQNYFTAWNTTEVIETSFNDLVTRQSGNPRGQLGRKARWHALATSEITSLYGREPPPASSVSKEHAAKRIPANMFDADTREFSLGNGDTAKPDS